MKWKASKNVKWVLNEVFGGGNENDNENENGLRRTRMDMDGGPQADFVEEQGLMNDERLLITDGVHTENTEENGCPQADGGGERQLENKYPQMSQMDTD